MSLSLIVAMSENRVIGRDGDLPWHLSADLRRFKKLTMGHHLVMGRKTFQSIGRPLPGRVSIVLSRNDRLQLPPGVLTARDLQSALQLAAEDAEIFIVGGGQVYCEALPLVSRLYVTTVHTIVEGDTHFPELDLSQWRLLQESHHPADEKNALEHSFRVFERRGTQ